MQEDSLSTTQPVSRRPRPASPASPTVAYVQVLSGQQAGLVVRVTGLGMVLGRGEDCHLILDEPGISRRHARILEGPGPEEFWLEDLGSTNGTYANDQEIQRHRLQAGDRIELGETTSLTFGQSSLEEIELAEKLYDCATRDSLTRALNRGSLFERMEQEIAYCKRHNRHLSVLMLDVDFFKQVNDNHGHSVGDFVLRFLAEQLRRQMRLEDVLGRYGGEEFCLLLRQTPPEAARETAERLRQGIESSRPVCQDIALRITVSIGVSSLRPQDTLDSLLARADGALYQAKASGRNRVEVEAEGSG
jgi:diguanylate cyclase (GGDEF)-like protein